MFRSLMLAAVPLTVLACSEAAPTEAIENGASDVTGIGDLAPLEANLGLVKDPARTRREEIVKAGPCYQKMEATGRTWNMRRYTKGAAFFFTAPNGTTPASAIECVDIDTVQAGRTTTSALSGLSLDLVMRYGLGKMTSADAGGGDVGFSFASGGAIEIGTIPTNTPIDLKANVPGYEGAFRGFIRSVRAPWVPADRTPLGPGQVVPSVKNLVPAMAMLAYRYAALEADGTLGQDAVGRFLSMSDESVGDFDAWAYTLHFEKVDVKYKFVPAVGSQSEVGPSYPRPARDWLTLETKSGDQLAGCTRLVDQLAHEYGCWVSPDKGKWEIPWGVDFD